MSYTLWLALFITMTPHYNIPVPFRQQHSYPRPSGRGMRMLFLVNEKEIASEIDAFLKHLGISLSELPRAGELLGVGPEMPHLSNESLPYSQSGPKSGES